MPSSFDRTDRRLLEALQGDARLTTAQLAEQVSLSTSPCWRRIKALEENGVIRGYHARLDAQRLGWGVTAFVHIMLENHRRDLGEQFEQAVLGIDRVIACHNVSGQYDYLLQVVAHDLQDFGEFARDRLRTLPGVKEINSSLSLREVKADGDLPVP